LKDIVDIHQNPLFCISCAEKELFIPANQEFILEIDTTKKNMWVELPEGLTDLS